MRLRQFVWVAEKLAPAQEAICDVLGLEVCYNDPGVGKFGLENALMALNGNLLEIVAPIQEGTTAGRYLERRGGDGGYMVILQCGDALAERARIAKLGVREIWRHDAETYAATHFHPADVPGAILSIDSMTPGEDWHQELAHWEWAGPDWQRHVKTDVSQAIVGVEMQADNPAAAAAQWSKVLHLPLTDDAHGPQIRLDNARLRFVEPRDDRGLGISGIDVLPQNRGRILQAAERRGLNPSDDAFDLCGLKVYLV